MNLRKTLTLALLGIGLSFGTQTVMMSQASAKPFETLTKSRKGGKRTHKKSDSSSKKKSDSSKSRSSSGTRRVTRTTTRPSTTNTSRTRTNVRPRTTTTTTRTRRPASSTHRHGTSTSTRTVRNVRPRTTTTRTTRYRRGATSRRTYYRSRSTRYRSSHSHSHSTYTNSSNRRGATVREGSQLEGYVTGGLGISGFASNEITDLPLPGAGYNVALGAKGKFIGGELGINGGGYTFDPGSASADIAMVGLSGDVKLQPSFGFFEPYIAGGLGGYALKDAVINEGATGLGLRAGVGADFRFQSVALRVNYQYGWYGLNDVNEQYDGNLSASTETLGANLVVYF